MAPPFLSYSPAGVFYPFEIVIDLQWMYDSKINVFKRQKLFYFKCGDKKFGNDGIKRVKSLQPDTQPDHFIELYVRYMNPLAVTL